MAMNYEELDARTRQYMLTEFEQEEASGTPYRSKALSANGIAAFPDLMREALKSGNEVALCQALDNVAYWTPYEEYTRDGVTRSRRRNVQQSAERLSLTEFSTWYVRGLAKRLFDEGELKCEVYRGAQPKWQPAECASHEGLIVSVEEIYANHRARYWPEPGNLNAFAVPFGPGCHHLIRRLQLQNQ